MLLILKELRLKFLREKENKKGVSRWKDKGTIAVLGAGSWGTALAMVLGG